MARLNLVFDFGAVVFRWEPRALVREIFPKIASTDAQAARLAHSIFGHGDWHSFDAGQLSAQEIAGCTHQRTALPLQVLTALVDSIAHGWRGVHLPRAHALRGRLFNEIGL